jgi:hypothetical protein
VFEGMARGIQYRSRADVAYETAIDYSTAGSFGAFRLAHGLLRRPSTSKRFASSRSWIRSPVYGFLIPGAIFGKRPKHGFVLETLTREEFEQQVPGFGAGLVGFDDGAQMAEGWITTRGRPDRRILVHRNQKAQTAKRSSRTAARTFTSTSCPTTAPAFNSRRTRTASRKSASSMKTRFSPA